MIAPLTDMETIKVIKIGGNVVDNPDALARFVNDFVKLPGKRYWFTEVAKRPRA